MLDRLIPPEYRLAAKLVAAGVLLALAFALGSEWTGRAWEARYNKDQAAAAKQLADAKTKALRIEREAAQTINDIETRHHAENQRAQAAYDQLLDDYRAGAVRLRSRFTCPATDGVPATPAGATGGKPAPSGGLQPADVQLLVRFGKEADEVVRQLTACQAILKADRHE